MSPPATIRKLWAALDAELAAGVAPATAARTVAHAWDVEQLREALAQSLFDTARRRASKRLAEQVSSIAPAAQANGHGAGPLDCTVPVAKGQWKPLGRCTTEELQGKAVHLAGIARRHTTQAQQYLALAAAIEAAGVERADELPAETVTEILCGSGDSRGIAVEVPA